MWNMDEIGCALGVCTNTQVLASSAKKKAYVKSSEDREWASIIETVSALGVKLQCLVIFKGQASTINVVPSTRHTKLALHNLKERLEVQLNRI